MAFERIAVMGLGKVGHLAAELLVDAGFDVTGHDARPVALSAGGEPPFRRDVTDIADSQVVRKALTEADAVLSCLPYHLNAGLAEVAHELGVHYFDLTEDVPTTTRIMQLAETSDALMAPQCGLAPGFVGIVAAAQIESFDRCRSIRMRVGALPQHPTGRLGYAFNWSPEGVVNEYLNDCEVIEEGVRKLVSPMEWHETIFVHGTKLEAFTTSGGLGTMCATYEGRVENLDYKTMRYPGHMDLMNFFFHEMLMRERRELAGEILTNAKPPVDEDVVHVHVAAEGEIAGQLKRREFVRSYRPIEIGGERRTAIAWTTASSAAAVIALASNGALPERGFLRQEDIPIDAFLATRPGTRFTTAAS